MSTSSFDNSDAMKRFRLFFSEYSKETDRAAVILAAAMIDETLGDLLRARLVPCADGKDTLLDGSNAPLGTVSARIDAAYRMGLISHRFARDLHIVRRIRNDFAHNIIGCSFEAESARSRVQELVRSWRMLDAQIPRETLPPGTRNDFLYVVAWMLVSMRVELAATVPIEAAAIEFEYNPQENLAEPTQKGVEPVSDLPSESLDSAA